MAGGQQDKGGSPDTSRPAQALLWSYYNVEGVRFVTQIANRSAPMWFITGHSGFSCGSWAEVRLKESLHPE